MSDDKPLKSPSYRPTPGGKMTEQEMYRHLSNVLSDVRELSDRIDRLAARVAALEAAP